MTFADVNHNAVETLRQGGIANPTRLVRLIQNAVDFLGLDLSGLTVLTEAASGPYVVTPIIAAIAGAERILALTQNSSYASVEIVLNQTRALEVLCGVEDRVDIYTQRSLDLFSQADLVTNLGFVRPINAKILKVMKSTAVVSLMCEAWEFRYGDVDLEACQAKGILVLGTNEDYPGLEVFTYSGNLCLKMLFDAQIEVYKSTIVIVGRDKFGPTIQQAIKKAGANAVLIDDLNLPENRKTLSGADVLVVADYLRSDAIIGDGGDITPMELAILTPSLTVLQYAGVVDIEGLRQVGISCHPAKMLGPHRMAFTLAELGPRPVVELHTAGLKVGEMAAIARQRGLEATLAESVILQDSALAQSLRSLISNISESEKKAI